MTIWGPCQHPGLGQWDVTCHHCRRPIPGWESVRAAGRLVAVAAWYVAIGDVRAATESIEAVRAALADAQGHAESETIEKIARVAAALEALLAPPVVAAPPLPLPTTRAEVLRHHEESREREETQRLMDEDERQRKRSARRTRT